MKLVDDSGAKLKINVTSFSEKMATSYYNVVEALELNPYALDVTYNSINKLANYSHYTTNNGKVMEVLLLLLIWELPLLIWQYLKMVN